MDRETSSLPIETDLGEEPPSPTVKKGRAAKDGGGKTIRNYEAVSNRNRIQIVIAMQEFGLECIWTSKLFGVKYSNVKTINLSYAKERKLLTGSLTIRKRDAREGDRGNNYNIPQIRAETAAKIISAIKNGFFPDHIAKRLTIQNISILLHDLDAQSYIQDFHHTFGAMPGAKQGQSVTLPYPRGFYDKTKTQPSLTKNSEDAKLELEERQTMKNIFFKKFDPFAQSNQGKLIEFPQ